MNPEEYARMHALETDYWWFAGRREIIGSLLRTAKSSVLRRESNSCDLLDIGCGTGANLPLLRGQVGATGYVTGVDFSPLALRFAGEQLSNHAQNAELPAVTLSQADALRLPFRDASFDVVTMLDVLEHLSDDKQALCEVRRVLRPGGVFVWSVPAYQKLWSAHDEALHHFRRYEMRGLQRLLRQNGFEVRLISFAMSLMPPVAWLWRRLILPFRPKRPRQAKRHSEGAVLPPVPLPLNRALVAYLKSEGRLISHRPLRFGTSLVGIARKRK